MSRIRVGDIEIDGEHVRVGQVGRGTSSQSPLGSGVIFGGSQSLRPAPLPRANYAFLDSIPISPGIIMLAGVLVAGLGTVGTLFGGGLQSIFDYVLRGTFLIPVGVGIGFMGVLKAIRGGSVSNVDFANADGTTEEYIAELGALLRHEDRSHTVEWVQKTLGWRQVDVVRTLAWLRERHELREEIDIDSGHYYYVATPRARNLDARLRSTNSFT